ncbi:hypothetical protein Tco_1007503 [Tanacetum coccineum]
MPYKTREELKGLQKDDMIKAMEMRNVALQLRFQVLQELDFYKFSVNGRRKLEEGLNNIWVKEEENMRKMATMKKIDGLNNEKGKRKWQSMVLEMKIEEIVCSKREVPARV